MSRGPHKLDLYRLAVQCPPAEVYFMINAYAHYRAGSWPTRLKEDFAGTSAVAMQWVSIEPDHEAIAVDNHGPTLRFARRRARHVLGGDADRLRFIEADVGAAKTEPVDIVCALNFSVLTWHTKRALLRYLRAARRSLRPGGMLMVDVYGGPGAETIGEQSRHVAGEAAEDIAPFDYIWEQRAFDPRTRRTDCRIHFNVGGRQRRDAFRYDWRLWLPSQLRKAMIAAGFERADIWAGDAHGEFEPVSDDPQGHDWAAYVIGC